jgi:hypothetical protein
MVSFLYDYNSHIKMNCQVLNRYRPLGGRSGLRVSVEVCTWNWNSTGIPLSIELLKDVPDHSSDYPRPMIKRQRKVGKHFVFCVVLSIVTVSLMSLSLHVFVYSSTGYGAP